MAVIGSAREAMLNAIGGEFWLKTLFGQKTNDVAERSTSRTDVDKHITIRRRPHV